MGLVVLNKNCNMTPEEVERAMVDAVREDLGAIANFKRCLVVERLPKTRSGKILRKLLRVCPLLHSFCYRSGFPNFLVAQAMMDGRPLNVPPTIEDAGTVELCHKALQTAGLCREATGNL